MQNRKLASKKKVDPRQAQVGDTHENNGGCKGFLFYRHSLLLFHCQNVHGLCASSCCFTYKPLQNCFQNQLFRRDCRNAGRKAEEEGSSVTHADLWVNSVKGLWKINSWQHCEAWGQMKVGIERDLLCKSINMKILGVLICWFTSVITSSWLKYWDCVSPPTVWT